MGKTEFESPENGRGSVRRKKRLRLIRDVVDADSDEKKSDLAPLIVAGKEEEDDSRVDGRFSKPVLLLHPDIIPHTSLIIIYNIYYGFLDPGSRRDTAPHDKTRWGTYRAIPNPTRKPPHEAPDIGQTLSIYLFPYVVDNTNPPCDFFDLDTLSLLQLVLCHETTPS